jgi:aerobic carbon-monoxide dehydrogenase medium subunit
MKPAPFEYHSPVSLQEALDLLGRLENAKVLAGGQSLVPMMNFRYAMPDHLVDLNRLDELAGIRWDGRKVRIGALTLQREIEFSPLIAEHLPLFRAALAHVGHRQTRNRGTIGGSLSHADPAAELPTACLALDAEIEIASPRGLRTLQMRDFNQGYMATALEPDEILAGILVQPWRPGHGYSFQEYARRHGDFAVAGVAAMLDMEGGEVRRATLAVCGVTPAPVRLETAETGLIGSRLDAPAIAAAAEIAGSLDALYDYHGGADYRRHLARVLTARALEEARRRIEAPVREIVP